MAQSEKYRSIVKEWRRQAFDLSTQLDDDLNSVFLKTFDVISAVFKSSVHRKIQHALESLESERSICLRFENTNEPSIRSLIYGVIESLHLAMLHLTEHKEPSEEAVSIVEEWKRQTFDFSDQSDDTILSVFLKVFEAISAILKTSEYCHNRKIQKALESLKSERIICLRFEETNDPSLRSMILGVIECIQFTLLHFTEKKTETKPSKEIPKHPEEVSRQTELIQRGRQIDRDFGLYRSFSVPSSPIDNGRRIRKFPLLKLPDELISLIFSFLPIKDRFCLRLNKRLNEIELKCNYFVENLYIYEESLSEAILNNLSDLPSRDQTIMFIEERSYSTDCFKRITQNISIGTLDILVEKTETFHRDICNLVKDFRAEKLEMCFMYQTVERNLMDDSLFLDWTRTFKSLRISNLNDSYWVSDKISPDALLQVYKSMMDGSTSLRELKMVASKNMKFIFLELLGITFHLSHGCIYSSKGIEVYEIIQEDNDEEFDYREYIIMDGKLAIRVSFSEYCDDISFQLYEDQESYDMLRDDLESDDFERVDIVPE